MTDLFLDHFSIIPDISKPYKTSEFPFRLFRARELNSFHNVDFITEHSYCPVHLTTGLGRCNFPGFPVFYCSNNSKVALLEVAKEEKFKNTKYCISGWDTISSNDRLIIQPFLFGELHPDNNFNIWKNDLIKRLNEPFENNLTKEQLGGLKLMLEFMSELFVNSEDYSTSATIAHKKIYALHKLKTDILIYPSVQTKYQGVNMAIHPNYVDKYLYPSVFYIVEINDIDRATFTMDFNCTSYGILKNSHIEWKDVAPSDEFYKECFKRDFNYNGDFNFTEVAP